MQSKQFHEISLTHASRYQFYLQRAAMIFLKGKILQL